MRFNYAYIMAAVILCLGLVVYSWAGLLVSKLECDILRAREVVAQLEEENRRLRLEWAMLTSPENISRRAKERLGLVVPRPEQQIIIEEGASGMPAGF